MDSPINGGDLMISKYCHIFLAPALLCSLSCKELGKNYSEVIDSIASSYGYIGYHSLMDDLGTGTLIGGGSLNLFIEAPPQECFPSEKVRRYSSTIHVNSLRQHTLSGQGGLGILNLLGIEVNKDYSAVIWIGDLSVEYFSAPDITRWYREQIDSHNPYCREHLNYSAFISESLVTKNIQIAIVDQSGAQIELNAQELSNVMAVGPKGTNRLEFEMIDAYTVEVTSPVYIGYKLSKLRRRDFGHALYKASTVQDGSFVFDQTSLFDVEDVPTSPTFPEVLHP